MGGRAETYEHFIRPVLLIVLQAADWLNRFPVLRRVIGERTTGG